MAQWLVTFHASLPEARRMDIIREAGAVALSAEPPVPLGDEIAVSVEAEEAAAATLRARDDVIAVFPNSDLTLY